MILSTDTDVFFYRHLVDMRKSIDGLVNVVVSEMKLDPTMNADFVFIGRRTDRLKILHYERNGFWLFYRRLIKQKFKWPRNWFEDDILQLDQTALEFFLTGCDLNGLKPFDQFIPRDGPTSSDSIKAKLSYS